jgi:hypothetical protein
MISVRPSVKAQVFGWRSTGLRRGTDGFSALNEYTLRWAFPLT